MQYSDIFTDGCEINCEYLRFRGFYSIPAMEYIDLMDAEWLVEAIETSHPFISELKTYSFEYDFKNAEESTIQVSMDAIMSSQANNSNRYLLITSSDLDFLVYYPPDSIYRIIAGLESFIKNAYRCSFQIAKEAFFDWNDDGYSTSKKDKIEFKRIWDKYAIFPSL